MAEILGLILLTLSSYRVMLLEVLEDTEMALLLPLLRCFFYSDGE